MSETTQSAMGTVMFVPLTAIQLGKNCRVVDLTTPDGERFVASVKARGVIQPLLVRPLDKELKQLELVAGYRRYFAAQQAGLKSLPVVARPMTDAEVLELQLIENLQREDLAAMDEARALDRLRVELGYSVDDIQAKIFAQTGKNVSRSHVYDTLSLVKLTAKAEAALREGKITRSQAIEIARLDADLQDNAVTRFAQSENSHRDSLRYIRDQFATEQEKKTRWAKAAKDAAARNIPVLSPKEAKALFPQEWSDRADAASGYVALSQVHYEDPKRRTFSQILGKANVAKSLVSCHGEPMFVVKIGDVAPILNKLKVPVPGEAKKAAADKAAATETKEQRTKRLAAEALANAVDEKLGPRMIELAVAKINSKTAMSALVACIEFANEAFYGQVELDKTRTLEAQTANLVRVLCGDIGDLPEPLLEHFGIKELAVRKQLTAELTALRDQEQQAVASADAATAGKGAAKKGGKR